MLWCPHGPEYSPGEGRQRKQRTPVYWYTSIPAYWYAGLLWIPDGGLWWLHATCPGRQPGRPTGMIRRVGPPGGSVFEMIILIEIHTWL